MPIKLAPGPPVPRDGSQFCSHGRQCGTPPPDPLHRAGKQTFPGPSLRRCPVAGRKPVLGSPRALLLPGRAQPHPPAAPGTAPVPWKGMTGAEPIALQPRRAALLAACPRCAPRLVLGAGRAATCGRSLDTTSRKPCLAVPVLCLTWRPGACEPRQTPTALGSSLGRPLRCCPPTRVQLPEPRAGAGRGCSHAAGWGRPLHQHRREGRCQTR